MPHDYITATNTSITNITMVAQKFNIDVNLRITGDGVVVEKTAIDISGAKDFKAPYLPMHALGVMECGLVKWLPSWGNFWNSLCRKMLGTSDHEARDANIIDRNGLVELETKVKAAWAARWSVDSHHRKWMVGMAKKVYTWKAQYLKGKFDTGLGSMQSNRSSLLGVSPKQYLMMLSAMVLDIPDPEARKWHMHDLSKLPPNLLVEYLVAAHRYLPVHVFRRYMGQTKFSMRGATYHTHMQSEEAKEKGLNEDYAPDVLALSKALWSMCYRGAALRPHTIGCLAPVRNGSRDIPDTAWHALLMTQVRGYQNTYDMDIDGHLEVNDKLSGENTQLFSQIKDLCTWVSETKPSDLLALDWHLLAPDKVLSDSEKDLLEKDTALSWDNPLNGWHHKVDTVLGEHPRVQGSKYGSILKIHVNWKMTQDSSWVTADSLINSAIRYIKDGWSIKKTYGDTEGSTADGKKVRAMPIRGSLSRMLKDARYNHNIERHLIEAKMNSIDPEDMLWFPDGMDAAPLRDSELEEKRVKAKVHLVLLGKLCHHCVGIRKDNKDSLFYWDGGTVVAEVRNKLQDITLQNYQDLAAINNIDMNALLAPHMTGKKVYWFVHECRDKSNHDTDASKAFSRWLDEKLAASNPMAMPEAPMEDKMDYDGAIVAGEGAFHVNYDKKVKQYYSTNSAFSVNMTGGTNQGILQVRAVTHRVSLEGIFLYSVSRRLTTDDNSTYNSITVHNADLPSVSITNGHVAWIQGVTEEVEVGEIEGADEICEDDLDVNMDYDVAGGEAHFRAEEQVVQND